MHSRVHFAPSVHVGIHKIPGSFKYQPHVCVVHDIHSFVEMKFLLSSEYYIRLLDLVLSVWILHIRTYIHISTCVSVHLLIFLDLNRL